MIRRRDFITLVGGAAAAWPLVARAQQPEHMRTVGLISGYSEPEFRPVVAAFKDRMQKLGWIEEHNLKIDARPAGGDYKRLSDDAGELVAAGVDVIVAMGTPGVAAVVKHSRTIPVVFTQVADPVAQGLVKSLARPGGNLTGFTNFEFSIVGKWAELAREIDSNISRLTLLINPENPNIGQLIRVFEDAGQVMQMAILPAPVRNAREIEEVMIAAARLPGSALFVFPDSLPIVHRALIVQLAEQHRLPTIYPFRVFPTTGGLMSYGIDYVDVYRQAASYTDRLLRGAKPSDLPAQAPTKFELVINLKTAKVLGLNLPPTLLARADEVIE